MRTEKQKSLLKLLLTGFIGLVVSVTVQASCGLPDRVYTEVHREFSELNAQQRDELWREIGELQSAKASPEVKEAAWGNLAEKYKKIQADTVRSKAPTPDAQAPKTKTDAHGKPFAENVEDFYKNFEFGKAIAKTSSTVCLAQKYGKIFTLAEPIGNLNKGYHVYLDNLHFNHVEVFNGAGVYMGTIDLQKKEFNDFSQMKIVPPEAKNRSRKLPSCTPKKR